MLSDGARLCSALFRATHSTYTALVLIRSGKHQNVRQLAHSMSEFDHLFTFRFDRCATTETESVHDAARADDGVVRPFEVRIRSAQLVARMHFLLARRFGAGVRRARGVL